MTKRKPMMAFLTQTTRTRTLDEVASQPCKAREAVIKVNLPNLDSDDDDPTLSGEEEDEEVRTKKQRKSNAKALTYDEQRALQIAENKAKMPEIFGTDSPSLTIKGGEDVHKGKKGGRPKGKKSNKGGGKDKGGKGNRKSTRLDRGGSAGKEGPR
jgi:hypothetical protein